MIAHDSVGPAFPQDHRNTKGEGIQYLGMTLRDYFAAKAMQGLLSSEVNAPLDQFADYAYQMADQMLKARET